MLGRSLNWSGMRPVVNRSWSPVFKIQGTYPLLSFIANSADHLPQDISNADQDESGRENKKNLDA